MKKFLDALKAESFSHETFPYFMEAFTSMVKNNLTAEIFRAVALFITYAYHKSTGSASRTPKDQGGTLPIRTSTVDHAPRRPIVSTPFDGKELGSSNLNKRQLGNKVLEMYANIVCEKGDTSSIRKFAKTVTNKVSVSQHATLMCLTRKVASPSAHRRRS